MRRPREFHDANFHFPPSFEAQLLNTPLDRHGRRRGAASNNDLLRSLSTHADDIGQLVIPLDHVDPTAGTSQARKRDMTAEQKSVAATTKEVCAWVATHQVLLQRLRAFLKADLMGLLSGPM